MNSPTMLLKFAAMRNDSNRAKPFLFSVVLMKPKKSRNSAIANCMCSIVNPYGNTAFLLKPRGFRC